MEKEEQRIEASSANILIVEELIKEYEGKHIEETNLISRCELALKILKSIKEKLGE